ncbi:hypothetical protein FHS72_003372 [Loktanella ponticola]|uniref:Uncharacterized protein n=1 Tax=Yoonia ponticola TaxID=1524255 RepID=A0A7W9EZE6_9RHOB|nr:hypothetical protein [Yoonia ponticola]
MWLLGLTTGPNLGTNVANVIKVDGMCFRLGFETQSEGYGRGEIQF